jgi:hypothetical protein
MSPSKDAGESTETRSLRMTARLDHALQHLNDRIQLNQNPLSRTPYIQRLAAARYGGRLLPRGLALRSVVLECVERISAELESEPGLAKPCQYLKFRSNGLSCKRIAAELKLSREHTSRVTRVRALQLLTEAFIAVTGNRD